MATQITGEFYVTPIDSSSSNKATRSSNLNSSNLNSGLNICTTNHGIIVNIPALNRYHLTTGQKNNDIITKSWPFHLQERPDPENSDNIEQIYFKITVVDGIVTNCSTNGPESLADTIWRNVEERENMIHPKKTMTKKFQPKLVG